MTSLFDHSYPSSPGFREPDTSRKAAESMAPTASLLREKCLAALRQHGPMTADEIAERVGITPFSCRPRCTELLALGHIADTGERRRNDSGRSAKVWRAI